MTTTARDVMTDSVISVSPETPLADVLRLFVESNVHGAPVVSDTGDLEGVVTTTDLLRAQEDERDTALSTSDYLRDLLEFSAPDWEGDVDDFQNRLAQRTVAEVMTRGALSVPADAPVGEVARCLRENQVHRVWVLDKGELCGVVSALDLMPVVESSTRG